MHEGLRSEADRKFRKMGEIHLKSSLRLTKHTGAFMQLRQGANAVLARTTGYKVTRPPAGRDWRPPSPERLNKLLSRTTGYQLSKPINKRARPLPPPAGRRLLTAPVFILSAARSGSTLTRVILGSHSRLYAPPELPLKQLGVRSETAWIRTSIEALGLTTAELDYMLWDRVLSDALERSGKPRIVVKTPSNVLIWEQLAECWPDAKFIVLLRHPAAAVTSLHTLWKPEWHPDESGTFEESVAKSLRYMSKVEEARQGLPALTVRYEELTADPEKVTREMCDFLDLPFEPAMLEYGKFRHSGLEPGLGDGSENIRSGRIQAAAPPPGEIPAALTEMCVRWGYLEPAEQPS